MFVLYKIYYDDDLVYLGRTKQLLHKRLYGHFFKKPMIRELHISLVSKIEYAECKTESDMNLYEIYYINKLKPSLNIDDKTKDELTIELPELEFKPFVHYLFNKWKTEILLKDQDYEQRKQENIRLAKVFKDEQKIKRTTLSQEEYLYWLDNQKGNINYEKAKIKW